MVKRKANVSIDEWLEGGVSPPGTSPAATVAAEEGSCTLNIPTVEEGPVPAHIPAAEVIHGPVPAEPVTTPVVDVAAQEEGEDHWFWTLLEQAGYERW